MLGASLCHRVQIDLLSQILFSETATTEGYGIAFNDGEQTVDCTTETGIYRRQLVIDESDITGHTLCRLMIHLWLQIWVQWCWLRLRIAFQRPNTVIRILEKDYTSVEKDDLMMSRWEVGWQLQGSGGLKGIRVKKMMYEAKREAGVPRLV